MMRTNPFILPTIILCLCSCVLIAPTSVHATSRLRNRFQMRSLDRLEMETRACPPTACVPARDRYVDAASGDCELSKSSGARLTFAALDDCRLVSAEACCCTGPEGGRRACFAPTPGPAVVSVPATAVQPAALPAGMLHLATP